nr:MULTISPECIES: metal-dependent transcriptional regulator [Sulfurisphaera]
MVKLSRRELSYLLSVKKYNDEGKPAKLSWISKDLNVSVASAYEEISHLESKGFLKKSDKGIFITDEGKKAIDSLLRAHRVIETFLVKIGLSPDQACNYTKQFDYSVPDEVIERIYEYLGKPEKCPHGENIPY